MKNRSMILLSLILTVSVYAYLILEWVRPSGSLALLITKIIFSIAGTVLAFLSVRKQRSALGVIALASAAASMLIMLFMFIVMLIMGMGA